MNSVLIFSQLPSIYQGIDFLAHDLSAHAGLEYEIVCLRSVNAECQERQAKRIAPTDMQRLTIRFKGDLIFDLPSPYSCRTRSPLL